MDESLPASSPLAVLAAHYRARRTGLLSIGPPGEALLVLLREGQVAGLGPAAPSPAVAPVAGPDDSARLRLEQVLREVGIRRSAPAAPRPAWSSANLRERLLRALVDSALGASFEEGARAPLDVAETAGATEPLILEAVRQIPDGDGVRTALGDLDRRLVATTALAEERTLTLVEGYLLSRIDGIASAREVLQLVPLDPAETERTLLGLLLTGRVEYGAARVASRPVAAPPEPEPGPSPEASPPGTPPDPTEATAASDDDAPAPAPFPEATPVEGGEGEAPPPAELGPETRARRREILETWQSLPLKNHFEVLGVEPGCTDADVKRAYVALVKRFHPDAHRDANLLDLHDVLEGIFIRVGEAWEVLGDARSRASYEARSGILRRPRPASIPGAPTEAGDARSDWAPPPPSAPPSAEPAFVPPEETLLKAQLLLAQARYWDAIQMLEAAVPRMQPVRQQNRGRILLARAYAKNPNWLRRAEETLQDVVRLEPTNADAHYELGLVYKSSGLAARAQAQFRRVVELRPDHREASLELEPGPGPGGGGILKRLFGRGKAS